MIIFGGGLWMFYAHSIQTKPVQTQSKSPSPMPVVQKDQLYNYLTYEEIEAPKGDTLYTTEIPDSWSGYAFPTASSVATSIFGKSHPTAENGLVLDVTNLISIKLTQSKKLVSEDPSLWVESDLNTLVGVSPLPSKFSNIKVDGVMAKEYIAEGTTDSIDIVILEKNSVIVVFQNSRASYQSDIFHHMVSAFKLINNTPYISYP